MRLLAFPVCFFLLCLLGCDEARIPVPHTIAELAQEVEKVFETPVDYSDKHVDSADVFAYLVNNPFAQADSAAIIEFYRRRAFQYAWFLNDSLSFAAGNFLDLVNATDTVLGSSLFDQNKLRDLVNLLSAQDSIPVTDSLRQVVEITLTARFFQFADKRYGGFVKRDLRELDWYIPRRKKNVDQLLDSLVAGRMDLSPLEPVHPQYKLLKGFLKLYRTIEMEDTPSPILIQDSSLELGDSSDVIVHVRDRLAQLGDIALNDSSGVFDSTLFMGVRSYQQRFGMNSSGVLDAEVVAELNRPIKERVEQILVNMERLRWLDPDPPADYILVNIPEYRMHVFEGGKPAWDMKVVVGATATRTVVFSGDLSMVVMAPYWNIPQSIISAEILPALKRSPAYLRQKKMEVVRGGVVSDPRTISWSKYAKSVPFTIRQKPGPHNALGLVKFLFPNQHSIYFHDTPSKGAFDEEKRAFSHGCIRLSEPVKLAEYLLRNDSAWTKASIKEAMHADQETIVKLADPVPVVIGYFTAWVDAEGRLNFRDDIYGHDARLASELFVDEGVELVVQ